jgi:hypothetical protein
VEAIGAAHLIGLGGIVNDLTGPGEQRVCIEVASEQEDQLEVKPQWTAVGEAMQRCSFQSKANDLPYLIVAKELASRGSESLQVYEHLGFELTPGLLFEHRHLLFADDEQLCPRVLVQRENGLTPFRPAVNGLKPALS